MPSRLLIRVIMSDIAEYGRENEAGASELTEKRTASVSTATTPATSTTTRRRLLAAGGLLALGGLAGCVDAVASRAVTTYASPASTFAGDPREVDARGPTHVPAGSKVTFVPAAVRGTIAGISGEVDLDTWGTSTAVYANDYNSVRSNKRRSTWDRGAGDGDADDDRDADDDADAADDDLDAALDAYLGDEPLIAEGFVVSVPDARLPQGGPAIVDELTPRRVLEYATGKSLEAEGQVYAWGHRTQRSVDPRTGEEDRCGPDDRARVCGSTSHLSADLTGPTDTGGGLVSRSVGGSIVVTNTPPTASDEGASVLRVTPDGEVTVRDDLDEWGPETGDHDATPALVCQMLAQPPDCPTPLPALFHLRRCRHDDQYLYVGGWTLDETALFEDGLTLLTAAGAPEVVGVSAEEVAGDDYPAGMARRLRGARGRQGSCVFGGEYSARGSIYRPNSVIPRRDGARWPSSSPPSAADATVATGSTASAGRSTGA